MTIKEVSETYGLSQDTLRYYERVGMIPRVTRSQSGHRNYQEKDLAWVELAKCLRNAGLTVEAIVEYVRLSLEGDSTIGQRLLKQQREGLLVQRQQMDEAIGRLEHKIDMYAQKLK
jgi:DNA-binding transcriptional MerR regulator